MRDKATSDDYFAWRLCLFGTFTKPRITVPL